jgi:hypothetical protein
MQACDNSDCPHCWEGRPVGILPADKFSATGRRWFICLMNLRCQGYLILCLHRLLYPTKLFDADSLADCLRRQYGRTVAAAIETQIEEMLDPDQEDISL